jgi:hypothetical protein
MDRKKQLIEELFKDSEKRPRCPYIERDKLSPFCNKDRDEEKVDDVRRMVCDPTSLQLYCLVPDHTHCIYYKGESLVD